MRQDIGASRGQETRTNKREDTGASERQYTRASRRQDTQASRRISDGRSNFSGEKGRKSWAAGEKLKTDDVWNKFLDDRDVIRAPTAETRQSYVTVDSRTETQTEDSEFYDGFEDPHYADVDDDEDSDEYDDESEDNRTIYSNYYLDHEYLEPERTPEPRVEILDGKTHEACNCFPNRGDKTKGSMLYDKIKCKHTGLTGHTHTGVFKFNPYWNENMEIPRKLRKRDMRYPKTKFFFGYPKPRFEPVSDTDEDSYSNASRDYRSQGRHRRSVNTKISYSDHDDDYDADTDNSNDDLDENFDTQSDDDDEDQDYVPFELPQIGYPKTPSLPRSSLSKMSFRSKYSDVPDSLPDISKSQRLTAVRRAVSKQQRTTTQKSNRTRHGARTAKTSKSRHKTTKFESEDDVDNMGNNSRRRSASRQSLPTGPVINTTRNFQGRFYDPATKQIMLYDIKKESEKHLPTGIIEPLYKPPQDSDQKQLKSKAQELAESQNKPGQTGAVGMKAAILGNIFIHSMLKGIRKTGKGNQTSQGEFA